ncbi:class I SAM-dependent methyltransferase [Endozoicomonas elysicola]|uniref:Methyltransferase type 12 domain-containing protein n=1 Tax=Endozoicomonas elysicola TaxID=305900 RepID=A0A081KCY3_9GAMM|nr:class I SAM-dependent methyltransferase [Endozoicomonas elysicola]KEI72009.1 hypothetical protein GV64_15900 [Endozoicomonas elysicola]
MTEDASTTTPSRDSSHAYALSNRWERAKERLNALQNACDKTTQSWLEFIKPGDYCLEIGPGNGSMAHWTADRVLPKGQIDILDIDDQFLSGISSRQSNVTAIHADILDYDLGINRYDVIYMRIVLCHLVGADYQALISRCTKALKAGGILFIQDLIDLDYLDHLPEVSNELKTYLHKLAAAANKTMDFSIGPVIPNLMVNSGLKSVRAQIQSDWATGGSNMAILTCLTLKQLDASGLFDNIENHNALFDELMAFYENPGSGWFGTYTVSSIGMKEH